MFNHNSVDVQLRTIRRHLVSDTCDCIEGYYMKYVNTPRVWDCAMIPIIRCKFL